MEQQTTEFPFPTDSFLSTANILQMNQRCGLLTYLEMCTTSNDSSFPEVSLKANRKSVMAESHQISSKFPGAPDIHGINAEAALKSVLLHELLQYMQKRLLSKYRDMGNTSRKEDLNWRQRKLQKWFGLDYPLYVGAESRNTHVALVSKVLRYCNLIAAKSRMGSANFCVVSAQIGCLLQDHPMFVYPEIAGKINMSISTPIYLIGSIGGVKVYVDAHAPYNENRITLGRTPLNSDAGVYLCLYKNTYDKIASPVDLSLDARIISDHAVIAVGDLAYKSYYEIPVVIGNKPLWRKILAI